MNYVISDLHGNYEGYIQMLKKIDLKELDNLYMLGDVIDRGSFGLRIFQDMMLRPNVYPIVGNHEYMAQQCLRFLTQEVTEDSLNNISAGMLQGLTEWINVGGNVTIKEFRQLSIEEREDIIDYLSEFSLYETVRTCKGEFVLVHAGLENFDVNRKLDDYDISELVFRAPKYDKVYYPNKFLVTGHLPTRVAYAAESGLLLEELLPSDYQDEIYENNNHIAIDCGSGYGGKIGCICLDTFEKYYI